MTNAKSKTYYENSSFCKGSKYTVHFYDGINHYEDGSPLWHICFCKNKKEKKELINKLLDEGYTEREWC